MTRLTIDLPNGLHKVLKSFSVVNGQTMKNIAISALERYVQVKIGKGVDNNSSQITEGEADKLLEPILMEYAKQIQEGIFKGEDWRDVEKEIKAELK